MHVDPEKLPELHSWVFPFAGVFNRPQSILLHVAAVSHHFPSSPHLRVFLPSRLKPGLQLTVTSFLYLVPVYAGGNASAGVGDSFPQSLISQTGASRTFHRPVAWHSLDDSPLSWYPGLHLYVHFALPSGSNLLSFGHVTSPLVGLLRAGRQRTISHLRAWPPHLPDESQARMYGLGKATVLL